MSAPADRSDADLYRLVRDAVEDALWNVLATLLFTALAVFAFLVAVQFAVVALGDGGVAAGLLALLLFAAAVYGFASTWHLGPFGE